MAKGRIVYCLYEDCQIGYSAVGSLPATCPECNRPAQWTTHPPFKTSEMDRRFLHQLRISPE